MNNKNTLVVVALVAVLLLAALYLWFSARERKLSPISTQRSSSSRHGESRAFSPAQRPATAVPDLPAANLAQKDKENVGKIVTAFSAPIEFYGRVIDQYREPVAGAKIHYSAADQYFGDSSKYEGLADASGSFSIAGIKGAGLYVSVYKDGYDGTKQSGNGFGYGVPSGNSPPTREKPAVFMLRKKAEAAPLIAIDKDVIIPKDGTPVDVSLQAGTRVPVGTGDLTIECWANDEQKDARRRYEWHLRLSVRGGGLIERRNSDSEFEAPLDGYQPVEEFQMSQSAERWRDSFEKNYFVRLGNGSYARMRFRITTGGDHFASIISYLNPQRGSRNLEFDPLKIVKPPH